MPAAIAPAKFSGAWATPEGWRPTWYWTGDLVETERRGKVARFPDLRICRLPKDVREAVKLGWIPAREMPIEVKRIGIDYYGSDLTPDQRAIFAEAIDAREVERKYATGARTHKTRTARPKAPTAKKKTAPKGRKR